MQANRFKLIALGTFCMIISISAGVDLGNDFLEDINYISADNGMVLKAQ
ncbi:MAG: hypothetical protein IPL42_02020 [Saprospiraceae bacterium]|nr:hypothetical protein [Saprospiraceae bacterium]